MQQWLTNEFTMSEVNIGSLITNPELFKKDAVHMAMVQIRSSDRFLPGEHVGLNDKGEAIQSDNPIGIVDPFLKKAVEPGDPFWLWMYPKTISNLRHDWNHPALDKVEKSKKQNEQPETPLNREWILLPTAPLRAEENQPVNQVITTTTAGTESPPPTTTNPEEDFDDGCSGCN